ncbi:MAG: glycosyltransferase family 39 protein [Deltaproteobacteria bacterium]|nr:glycosyltransferase family 39 protein [Deltaproteobacteria bacterium]
MECVSKPAHSMLKDTGGGYRASRFKEPSDVGRSRIRQLIYVGLALLLYLIGLGRPPLWEPDEGRYAEIAREMAVDHDYVTPRNNFVRYFEKPPLVYWVTAASLKVFGHNEFAVRLQAAIASIGQVAITGALAERMFGANTGPLAALALGLSPLFFAFARFATPDPALAFFLTAAMACFYNGAQSSEFPGRLDGRWMLAAAAMLALGTLAKGPVALVLGGAIATFWLVWENRIRDIWKISWLKCIALYLALTVPWFIVVAWRNPGFLHFFIIHEHFERYVASTEHGWGPWFYIPITIAGTWPWFYFAPLALTSSGMPFIPSLWPFGRGSPTVKSGGIDCENERTCVSLRFLLIWFAVVLVFFSIPRSKLGEYILPGLPPIGILAGRGLVQIGKIPVVQRRNLLMIFAAINAAAAITITAAIMVAPGHGLNHILAGDMIIAAIALLTGGMAPLLFARGKTVAVMLPLAISAIVGMGVGIDARERVASLVSYRNLAGLIAPYTSRGCRLMSYRHFEQALPFYTGVQETLVNYRGELEPFGPLHDPNGNIFATAAQLKKAWAADQCVVLVANRIDVPILVNLLSPAPTLIGCEGKKLALFNRPLDPHAQIPGKCASATAKLLM